jgi:hypothetical protein
MLTSLVTEVRKISRQARTAVILSDRLVHSASIAVGI